MNEVRLKNFRCFRDEQTARLAPLTLLVGENSTGKTSFLALIRALWDTAYRQAIPNFREIPYDLGSFDEIAHYRGDRSGRVHEFTAGFDAERLDDRPHHFRMTFGRRGADPVPTRSHFQCEDVAVSDHVMDDWSRELVLQTDRGKWLFKVSARLVEPLGSGLLELPRLVRYGTLVGNTDLIPLDGAPELSTQDGSRLGQLFRGFDTSRVGRRPFASAPVRSKPRRTCDPSRPTRDPEGETVPMYLFAAFFEGEKRWKALKEAIEEFGRDAGLFDELSVRPLGKRGSEPFQMHVRKFGRGAKGPLRNVIDVGYGVSQVLPVITELFRDARTPMFLLQQPEVHLHPSAQAALGSLFCQVASKRRQLVVETHSDHLLDRVRMDVRDGIGKLKPEDVSILYFERGDLDARIHSLRLDGEGNVLGAPPGYRRFFLDETRRSLRL